MQLLTFLQKKEAKAEVRILDMNVAFAPEKLRTPTSLQISYLNDVCINSINDF